MLPTETSAANTSLKVCIKLMAVFVTFTAVLSAGIISKGAIFFMTSQMGREMTQLTLTGDCQQHVKGIACWLWALLFSFAVPEFIVFVHSLRICFSRRKLWKRPRLVQFVIVFGLESGQTVGMALLVGSVLPYLSVAHGVLITNCVYLLPVILNLLNREPDKPIMKLMDALSFLAQLSGFLHWIFIRHVSLSNSRIIDWALPVSLILISFGWWENHVNGDAPISFIRCFGRIKKEMKETKPFTYAIMSAWKIVLFFATIFTAAELALVAQEAHDSVLHSFLIFIRDGFNQFWYSFMSVEWTSPFYIFIIQATCSFLFYWFSNFACQIDVKRTCFALPVVLMTPVIMMITSDFEIANLFDGHSHAQIENQPTFVYLLALSFFWFLSQTWINLHIWSPAAEISNELVGDTKWYNSLLIDQSMSLSPTRHHDKINELTSVYAVATMWHETSEEMLIILKSIFRMDKDQSRRHLTRYCNNKVIDPHCYHYETHIFFDDAFESHSKDGTPLRVVNHFVNQLIELMNQMNLKRTTTSDHKSPVISVTPYGGRLEWILPGNTKMTVHLKDKSKIRVKKRWSQVMYIDYLIRYEIGNHSDLENTFLLTLDGDMDFWPKAVHILVDVMKSQRDVGIACNRSHPTGSAGPMVWYQMFEYGVGFWLLKPSESVLGNILCAAGCFSLIRATVLMDGDVMSKFAERSAKAYHFIQRDQGEDRWLCTLLTKRGYRLAYSASSYAYTRCPETFNEFYNQRRRWTLSIISNTLDLLWNARQIVKLNPSISWIYMIFQVLTLAGGLLCPGSIFLVLVNTSATIFFLDKWISLIVHSALILGFIIICFVSPSRIQLRVAKYLSTFYGLIVAAVLIDSVISLAGYNLRGNKMSFSLNNAFFLFLTSCVFLAGCLHPREIHCLLAGPIYLLLTPSMSMLLVLYSIINMNVVSWGTRDSSETIGVQSPNKDTKLDNQQQQPNKVVTNFQGVFGPAMMDKTNAENACSNYTASINWSLEAESNLPEQRNVKELPGEECSFWKELIQSKLFPIVENRPEEKDRISADLDRLRNISFTIFFLLNSLFVATIFGCQMKNEVPESSQADTFSPSNELTPSIRVGPWLSEANPAQLTVIFFAGSMLFVQLAALLTFRLDNLIRMLSSTSLNIFRFKTESHAKSNAATLSNPVVLLSYGTAAEDSTRNRREFCQMNPNSWI